MRNPNGFLNDGQPRSLKRATPSIREWCRFQPLSCLQAITLGASKIAMNTGNLNRKPASYLAVQTTKQVTPTPFSR
jgi:hypothetical protein